MEWATGTRNLMLSAAIYQINQTNVVTPDLALDPTGSTSVQTGEVRSRGIELSGVGNVTHNFSVIATAKYDW